MKKESIINEFGVEKILVNASIDELESTIKVDVTNFFEFSVCNFKEVKGVDFKADYVSDSGSKYMYTEEGVYRMSDHWGADISTCIWLIDGNVSYREMIIGFAKWEDFKKYVAERGRVNGISPRTFHESITAMLSGEMIQEWRLGMLKVA